MAIIDFDDTRWLCPVIFKNGYSTLAYVYYHKKTGKLLNRFQNGDDQVWRYLVNNKYSSYPDYKVFAVWRNPYRRLISMYTDIVSAAGRHSWYIRETGCSREELLSDIGLFVEKALMIAENRQDPHVNRWVDEIKDAGLSMDKIDVLVNIDDLQSFIINELKFDKIAVRRNTSRTDIDVSGFEKYRGTIESFYSDDYEIATKYSDKFYIAKPYVLPRRTDPLSLPGKDVNPAVLWLTRHLLKTNR